MALFTQILRRVFSQCLRGPSVNLCSLIHSRITSPWTTRNFSLSPNRHHSQRLLPNDRRLGGLTSSMWLTPSAMASSYSVIIVGFRRPRSRLLTYCWLNPETSANSSCVRPFFCLILLTFRPTSLRISMRNGQRITHLKFINYSMYLKWQHPVSKKSK
jgi:hypothetical protein